MQKYLYTEIFSDTDEVQSFLDAMSYFHISVKTSKGSRENLSDNHVIEGLQKVSKQLTQKKHTKNQSLNLFYQRVEQNDPMSSIDPNKILKEKVTGYFSFLDKSLEEDFYSDHLNAFLNHKFECGFHNNFLNRIITSLFGENSYQCKELKSYREISLRNFDYKPAPQMRMDLFITMDNKKVVIIENKTKTSEHSNQTQHYYDACRIKHPKKDIYPIMLSPNSQKADCEEYTILNYSELFYLMTKSIIETEMSEKEFAFIADFYLELKNQFYDPYHIALERAKKFRSKCG